MAGARAGARPHVSRARLSRLFWRGENAPVPGARTPDRAPDRSLDHDQPRATRRAGGRLSHRPGGEIRGRAAEAGACALRRYDAWAVDAPRRDPDTPECDPVWDLP